MSFSDFVRTAPRFLFFTGKGGVGKTTLSCATAAGLAERDRRVLLISTDPASNLSEVLGVDLGTVPVCLPSVPTLWALNIDPEQAAHEYRERIVAPYRGVLPDAVVRGIEEQLSGACTTEIAAFNEFTRYLGEAAATAAYDHVVFDTAPTGHTLRLLQLPAAWNHFLNTNTSGTSCLGPLSGLREQHAVYVSSLACLTDGARTKVALVSRPERPALAEADRSRSELCALGLQSIHLLVNGRFEADDQDPVAQAMADRQQQALEALPAGLRDLPRTDIPLRSSHLIGLEAIRSILRPTTDMPAPGIVAPQAFDAWPSLAALIRELETQGRGVILTMGKGGVGKTTIAAAVSVELAARGHRVHLTTTDPAAHIDQAVGSGLPNLETSRIDPAVETAAYAREVMATVGAELDDDGRRLLEEDLRSPCTEEIAVFRAFAARVDSGRDGFVVLDTAPTGHTLLLLDATEAYHREVLRTQSDLPDAVRQLLPRLRDPDYSKAILVTLPEATPVHEAAYLQADLERAGIRPFAWIVNQALTPLALSNRFLLARQQNERPFIDEARTRAPRFAVVPWLTTEPQGVAALRRLSAEPQDPEKPTVGAGRISHASPRRDGHECQTSTEA